MDAISPKPLFQSESTCEVCYECHISFILKLELIYITNFALRLTLAILSCLATSRVPPQLDEHTLTMHQLSKSNIL